ncbi:unnamed protein product [Paramecium sonneborni]|uniref:Myb-like DNA-binding domain-containing protein n=1 Tax=Paramecium sonneborni TaxID=65129 RepID=A0A8S1KZZ7_9CILI|nr:unnamed protein product [Paramecium sonneborni]CAD8059425.1 unnamed protein product [Paramecium sonneborni]
MFRKYSFSEEIVDNDFSREWNWDHLIQDSNSKGNKKRTSLFTQQEDDLLCEQVALIGRKWKKIASQFPNKSDRILRNRFIKLQQQSDTTDTISSPKLELSIHEEKIYKKRKINEQQLLIQVKQLKSIKQKIDLISILVKQTKIELINLLISPTQ